MRACVEIMNEGRAQCGKMEGPGESGKGGRIPFGIKTGGDLWWELAYAIHRSVMKYQEGVLRKATLNVAVSPVIEFKVEYAEFIQELCVSLVGVVEEKGKIQRSAEWCVWRTRTVHNPSEWGGTGPRGRRMGEDDEEGKHGTGACEKYCVRNAVGRIARSPRKPSEGG